jgi:hypothetical protein
VGVRSRLPDRRPALPAGNLRPAAAQLAVSGI